MRLQRWQAAGQKTTLSLSNENNMPFSLEKEPKFSCWDLKCTRMWLSRDGRPLGAKNQVRGHCHSTCMPPKAYYPSSRCQEGSNLKEDGLGMEKESATAATACCSCWVREGAEGFSKCLMAPQTQADWPHSFCHLQTHSRRMKGTQCWCQCCLSPGRKAGTTAGHAQQMPGRGQDQESPCTPLWNDLSSDFSKRTDKTPKPRFLAEPLSKKKISWPKKKKKRQGAWESKHQILIAYFKFLRILFMP